MYPELSEAERFPLLTTAGRAWLHRMRQHPRAPMWNWPNGEQLQANGLAQVRRFAESLAAGSSWRPGLPPAWLAQFVDRCLEDVPFYRSRATPGTRFELIPSCSRTDLAPRVWEFVPDSEAVDELIVFSSSGTTGLPIRTPHSPASAACGIPLIERAIAELGVRFPRGVDQMALTNIAAYRGAYTTAIVMAFLEEAGCVRVNLAPEVWRQPTDCAAYLAEFRAPVMLGDPQAFAALRQVEVANPPAVMVSSIFELPEVLGQQLTAIYGCPVVDLYALTEAGIVAMKTPQGHVILPPDLYVEILDPHDQLCPDGVVGEVTLTGGRNPYLPLLRYRTGDFAAFAWLDGRPTLVGLEGRAPVSFPIADRVVHSMEVTRIMRRLPVFQYQLHQNEEGGFLFRYRGAATEEEMEDGLRDLLGSRVALRVERLTSSIGDRQKFLVYQSRHPGSASMANWDGWQ